MNNLSGENLAGDGAWEWDIVTGNVQWCGLHEQLVRSLPERDNGTIHAFTNLLHPDDRASGKNWIASWPGGKSRIRRISDGSPRRGRAFG